MDSNGDYKMAYELLLQAIQKAEADLALARKRAELTLKFTSERMSAEHNAGERC